jgi:hypothetical protein
MTKVEYDDMIGMPFKTHASGPDQFDCIGVVREVYRRAGWSDAALPSADNEAACVASIGSESSGLPWDAVDAVTGGVITTRLAFGDIVMVHNRTTTHVSVVVDASRQLALSSAGSVGVFASVTNRLVNVTAVYRMKESAR